MSDVYYLFLDDDARRIPTKLSWCKLPDVPWTFVRSYDEFVKIIEERGLPEIISFDHDLADRHYQLFFEALAKGKNFEYNKCKEKTGFHCVKWLIEYCMDNNKPVPKYYCHTQNTIGKENMISYIESYENSINRDS